MAYYTKNYNLKKPLPNEFYDVEDQNGNMDILDTVLAGHQKNTAVHLPMNGILPVERGGTGGITADDARMKLGAASNPNMLHNWYFGNPINQGGATEYTYPGYSGFGINRWSVDHNNGGAKFSVKDGFCRLEKTMDSDTHAQSAYQSINSNRFIKGETYTFSILCKGTIGYSKLLAITGNQILVHLPFINTDEFSLHSMSFTIPQEVGTDVGFFFYAYTEEGIGYTDVQAIKVEKGSRQTLAHQENGVWVLNEIPSYEEQMAICSQYNNAGAYIGHPRINAGTTDLVAGSSWMADNTIYLKYE